MKVKRNSYYLPEDKKGRSCFLIQVYGVGERNDGGHYADIGICCHLIMLNWRVEEDVVI